MKTQGDSWCSEDHGSEWNEEGDVVPDGSGESLAMFFVLYTLVIVTVTILVVHLKWTYSRLGRS